MQVARDGVYTTEEEIAEAESRGENLVRAGGEMRIGSKVYRGALLDDGTRAPLAIRNDMLNVAKLGNRAERRAAKRGTGRTRPPRHATKGR